ncbi:hypothetical protein B0H14DRAFT_2170664, partial [Mycena olivaceomarginata]
CFVCNKDGSSLDQEEGLCTFCPTASLKMSVPAQIVEHMAIHMLFDENPPADCCGFCLSTDGFCSIQLKKRKGRDGTNKIDLEHSCCPNAANLGLVNAAKSSVRHPCTNAPGYCPVPGCAEVIWKYNLKSHIEKTHTVANLDAYKSYYEIDAEERTLLKTASKRKTRERTKVTVNFKISEPH